MGNVGKRGFWRKCGIWGQDCCCSYSVFVFVFVIVFVIAIVVVFYFHYECNGQTWGQAGCCSDCGAGPCHSSHGSTNPGRSAGFQKISQRPSLAKFALTLRLALMLSPNWLPMFMLGPIVGLLAWTFLERGLSGRGRWKCFRHFYAKHRCPLISLAVGTSRVTAYFTSKATFVQMLKCFEQDEAGQAELIKQFNLRERLLRRAPVS